MRHRWLLASGSEVESRMEGRGHAVARHRLRPGLAHGVRLSAHCEAVEARNAVREGEDRLRGEAGGRRVEPRARDPPDGRYDIVTRTPAFFRQGLPLPRRPARQARHPRRRAAAGHFPRPAHDLAAHRLDGRRQDVPRGLAPRSERRRHPAWRPPLRRALRARASASPSASVERTKRPRPGPDARQRAQPHHGALLGTTLEATEVRAARPRHRGVRGHERRLTRPFFFTYKDFSTPDVALARRERRSSPPRSRRCRPTSTRRE